MSENKITYSSRTYDDYKKGLIKLTQQYYPDVFGRLDDASIGKWLIEILSDIGDNLNYHIDRTFQETSIDSASQLSSILNIARTNGLKIGGKKAALCEIEFSCVVPLQDNSNRDGNIAMFDENYCPIIKRGTLFSTGLVTFELMNDLNFAEQFNQDGQSDRKIEPVRNSNGRIIEYKLTKLAVVQAGQSKVFKKVISSSDIKPFMEVSLQDNDILGVESILVKQGTNFNNDPLTNEFYTDEENFKDTLGNVVSRYFEVDNLIEQYRFGDATEWSDNNNYNPIIDEILERVYEHHNEIQVYQDEKEVYYVEINKNKYPSRDDGKTIQIDGKTYDIEEKENNIKVIKNVELYVGDVPLMRCTKGKWKRLKNKFTTEYDDKWNLKITFGAGLKNIYGQIPKNAQDFTQYMMSRMQANDYMGVLPESGSTLYVLYRVGGGEMSNIATGTLTNIIYNNFEIKGNCNDSQNNYKKSRVRGSFAVTNTTPSYGGKDEPNEEEIKYMIKYNNASQNRCVTLHDYKAKINQLPSKYGCPFRIAVTEENNKVIIYALGLNSLGKLSSPLSETVADNIIEYLSHYKMLNDFIEFRSGKIVNISFELTVYIDKTYDKAEVSKRIIDTVYDYMDIKKHEMGDDIFLGDMTKQISQLDGVIQLSEIKAYDMSGKPGYSEDKISQELVQYGSCTFEEEYGEDGINENQQIDLKSSDMMLFSESNAMYEILDKSSDIVINVKVR